MSEMKGLVISGGKALRLRPLTFTGAKQLVPVANKPILFYAFEALAAAGIDDVTVVVSPETGDQVRQAAGDGARHGVRLRYVEQAQPLGVAHAIGVGREAIGDAPFVAFLGDNFLLGGIRQHVEAFARSGADASLLLKRVPDAAAFGVAAFEGERLVRVVEKPAEPPSDLAVIGIYLFRPRVFDAIASIRPSARGELEITEAIQWLLDSGARVTADVVESEWIDTGKHDDLLAANRLVLETLDHDIAAGTLDERSRLHGRVVLQPGAQVIDSVISGPAIIGERTVIERAYVGPFTSIGHDCRVAESEIAGSLVMDGTRIERLRDRVENSIIGRNVDLRADGQRPRGYQLVLGDYSKLRVP